MWKTLLVDDEESIRRLLKTVLEISDFEVITANSARSAIELLRRERFDVVVTDLRMESHLAGYEVAKAASGITPRPVTVIVTAFPVPPSEWRAVGADALLTKGGESMQIVSRLETILRNRRSTAVSAAAQSRAPRL